MLKNEIVNDYYKSLNGNYEDLIKKYINERLSMIKSNQSTKI